MAREEPPTDDEPTRVAGPGGAADQAAPATGGDADERDAASADAPPAADARDASAAADDPPASASSGLGGKAAEGAKTVGDRVTQAASATAQALRETDVREIAHHTTNLIENARPFFLAAFAVAFSVLAWVEDQTPVAVVFAIGAILFVLGAAYSREVDGLLTRGRDHDEPGD